MTIILRLLDIVAWLYMNQFKKCQVEAKPFIETLLNLTQKNMNLGWIELIHIDKIPPETCQMMPD